MNPFLPSLRVALIVALSQSLFACAAEDARHSMTVRTTLTPNADGDVFFVTASGAMLSWPADALRGRPWLGSTFAGGADVAIDDPLHHQWGIVPDSLEFSYEPPEGMPDGAYDIATTVYVGTEITDEIRNGRLSDLPFPAGGDVSTFTFDHSAVREGDPDFAPGFIRVNVEGGPVILDVANRTYREEDPQDVRSRAFNDTYLYLP